MRRTWPVVVLLALPSSGFLAQAATAQEGTLNLSFPAVWSSDSPEVLAHQSTRLRITGSATHPAGVEQVTAAGMPLFLTPSVDGSVRFDGYASISPDLASMVLEVVGRDETTFQRIFPLEVALPGADATSQELWNSAASGFRGERWAVVVGISDYQHPGIPDLGFAHRDAQQFAQFLLSPRAGLGGFHPDRVLLLTNEEATYRRLRQALRTFLKQPTEDDVVYLFWAGHGAPDPDRIEDLYLLPHDADPNDIASTAIPMEDLEEDLRRTLARDKIIITDACHSAGVGLSGTRALGGINQINSAFTERLARSTGGAVTITSSQASELSSEGRQWGGGHGVFTYHVLQGLNGAADENGDHIVEVQEMFEYVRERVRRETANAQTPTISQSSYNPSWPMAAVLAEDYVAPARAEEEPVISSLRGAMMMDILEGTWSAPDSMNAFLGVEDTLVIRMNGRTGPPIDGGMLAWASSNPQVARVAQGGRLEPLSPGLTTISAEYLNGERRAEVAVRVYDRPLQVEFTPRVDTIRVVRGDYVRLSAAMELPTGEVVRGVLPQFTMSDSLVVGLGRDESDRPVEGEFRAMRVGSTDVTGSLAGERWTWTFEVQSPGLEIYGIPSLMLAGQRIESRARYVRSDGSAINEALGVSWESSDSSVVRVRLDGIEARTPGQVELVASVPGTAQDTIRVSVLGDLLLGTERSDGRRRIHTYSFLTGELYTVLDDEYGGSVPQLSPDGATIAFVSEREGDSAPRIYLMNPDGSEIRRLVPEKKRGFLSFGSYYESSPYWSHDGGRVFFSTNRDGNYDIYSITADGNPDQLVRVTTAGEVERAVTASRVGPRIAWERVLGPSDSDIMIALNNGAEALNITADRTSPRTRTVKESRPAFIPGTQDLLLVEEGYDQEDGEALAVFSTSDLQRTALIVRPEGGKELLYTVSPDGRQVAYQQRDPGSSGDGRIVIVDILGNPIRAVPLPAALRLTSMSWAAIPHEGGEQ